MDSYSLSVAPLELFSRDGTSIGAATGFFFSTKSDLYLITNWHVVTGADPTTSESPASCPEQIQIYIKRFENSAAPIPGLRAISNHPFQLPLYINDQPVWFEHSNRQNIDVVALKISRDSFDDWANIPVNEIEQSPALAISAGMDCFVIGYPEGMGGPGKSPIWKRASAASEPAYDWRDQPRFLIDTATRSGMSGSPVIARHSGILIEDPAKGLQPNDMIGTVTKFVGIYSGRIGDDPLGLQLGVVWRADVLNNILSLQTRGMNPFR